MLAIPQVLDDDELKIIQTTLVDADFADGQFTAGFRAKRVKHNQQLKRNTPDRDKLNQLIIQALNRNVVFQRAVIPNRIHTPLFSRYRSGMDYGWHVDDALMNKPETIRTDVSITLFLTDAEAYEGGELVVRGALGEQMIKLDRGDAIVYPASTLHRVAPVTRGERCVAVTWAQSVIRDSARREVIFELDRVRRAMHTNLPDLEETDVAHKVYANLLRMWCDL